MPEYIISVCTMMMHLPASSTSHTECVFLCDTETMREKDNKKATVGILLGNVCIPWEAISSR